MPEFAAKLRKYFGLSNKKRLFLHFFVQIFGHVKKKQKFCRRLRDSVAQQVEHIPFKDGVLGSSPS